MSFPSWRLHWSTSAAVLPRQSFCACMCFSSLFTLVYPARMFGVGIVIFVDLGRLRSSRWTLCRHCYLGGYFATIVALLLRILCCLVLGGYFCRRSCLLSVDALPPRFHLPCWQPQRYSFLPCRPRRLGCGEGSASHRVSFFLLSFMSQPLSLWFCLSRFGFSFSCVV